MVHAAVSEVVQDVVQKDPDYQFLEIVRKYYDENVQIPEFPWD